MYVNLLIVGTSLEIVVMLGSRRLLGWGVGRNLAMSLPVAPLASPDEDRAEIGRLLASGRPRLADRTRIVLACAEPSAKTSQALRCGQSSC
jgi:hypothetical protein